MRALLNGNNVTTRPTPQLRTKDTQLSTRDEVGFKKWYATMSEKHQLNPDPSGQFYDYRGAYLSHASPDKTGHWPSTYKQSGHPNEFVGGFSTITGKRQPGMEIATVQKLKELGWDEAFARENGSDKASLSCVPRGHARKARTRRAA
jgi:hypothetical protein